LQLQIEKSLDFEALAVAVFEMIDKPVPGFGYEKLKFDIDVLGRWRKSLKATQDSVKCIAEVILTIDMPFKDFSNIPNMNLLAISKYLDTFLGNINSEYEQLKVVYKKGKSLDSAKSDYQILTAKGKEELKKAILADPNNAPMILFWSGDLQTICKQFAGFLSSLYPDIKPLRKPVRVPSQQSAPTKQTPPTKTPKVEIIDDQKTPVGTTKVVETTDDRKTAVVTTTRGQLPLSPIKKFHDTLAKKQPISPMDDGWIKAGLLAAAFFTGVYLYIKYIKITQ